MIPPLLCCSRGDEAKAPGTLATKTLPARTPVASRTLSSLLDKWVATLEETYRKQLLQVKPLLEDSIQEHIKILIESEQSPIQTQNVQISLASDVLDSSLAADVLEHMDVPSEKAVSECWLSAEPEIHVSSAETEFPQQGLSVQFLGGSRGETYRIRPSSSSRGETDRSSCYDLLDGDADSTASCGLAARVSIDTQGSKHRTLREKLQGNDSNDIVEAVPSIRKKILFGNEERVVDVKNCKEGMKFATRRGIEAELANRKSKQGRTSNNSRHSRRTQKSRMSSVFGGEEWDIRKVASARSRISTFLGFGGGADSGERSVFSSSQSTSALRRLYGNSRTNTDGSIGTNRGESFSNQVKATYQRKTVIRGEGLPKERRCNGPRICMHTVATSTHFKLASGAMIFANGIFVGFRMQLSAQKEFGVRENELDLQLGEFVFIFAFCLELGLRLAGEGCAFFYNKEWRWNLFDFFIVVLSVVELLLDLLLTSILPGPDMSVLRLIRIARVIRLLKFINMIPFFRHIQDMITSVVDSLTALMPAIVLLLIIMYIFGMMLLQGVISFVAAGGDEATSAEEDLQEWWGNVPDTMLTLLFCITNGISWHVAMVPLRRLHWMYLLIFLSYVLFVQIGVLNIVTGIFVDTVHQMFKPEREDIVEREALRRKQSIAEMVEIFLETDKDRSGKVSFEEFAEHLADEKVQIYMESLSLDVSQAPAIFDLMDSDGSGEVDIEEFVDGFLNLRGQAKSVDLWLLKRDHKKLVEYVRDLGGEMTRLMGILDEGRGDSDKATPHGPGTGSPDSDSNAGGVAATSSC